MTDESKPRLLRRWSRRGTAWVVGVAALAASGSAVAVVAASGDAPKARPSGSQSSSASSAQNQQAALDAILGKDPNIGQSVDTLIKQRKLPKPTYAGDTGRVGVPAGAKAPTAKPGLQAGYLPGPSSGNLTPLQMASLALTEGCSAVQAPIAGAIGAAESGGNPGAQGDIGLEDATWDSSSGLWQVRGLRSERGTGGLRDSAANTDPVTNAKAMVTISNGCTNWTPWSTYNNGAYRAYLSLMNSAVGAATQYFEQTGSYPSVTGAPISIPAPKPVSTHPVKHHKKKRKPKPKPKTSSSAAHKTTAAHPASSSAQPAPATSSHPVPAPSPSTSKVNLPTKLPIPTKPPTKLPTKLPIPTKLPTTLPVPLPTLPGLGG